MKVLELDEYTEYYETHKRLPLGQYYNPNKKLNTAQLESKYQKYLVSLDKQKLSFERQIEKQKLKQKLKQKEAFANPKKSNIKRSSIKKVYKKDEKWEACKKVVAERDRNQCQLFSKLSYEDQQKASLLMLKNPVLSQLDNAHIFSRGSTPHMKYMSDNVVLLSRVFHSALDSYISPTTLKTITKDEHEEWWRLIVGNDKYDELKEISRKR